MYVKTRIYLSQQLRNIRMRILVHCEGDSVLPYFRTCLAALAFDKTKPSKAITHCDRHRGELSEDDVLPREFAITPLESLTWR